MRGNAQWGVIGGKARHPGCLGTIIAQWFLIYKQTHHPRTLPQAYAQGPRGVLGGGRFLVGEVPLWGLLGCVVGVVHVWSAWG